MKLKVLGSSSKGNCYILENDTEALIIEAGLKYQEVKIALDFNVAKIKGVIISHIHGDHAKYTHEYLDGGIKCYANFMTLGKNTENRTKIFEDKKTFMVGNKFTVYPFPVVHDVPNHSFIIKHKDIGSLIFVTDTAYIPTKYKGVNHWMMECNHDIDIMDKRVAQGLLNEGLAIRIKRSHFGIQTLTKMFNVNDLSDTKSITLIHLSEGNSNADMFKKTIQMETGKIVYVADKGLEVEL